MKSLRSFLLGLLLLTLATQVEVDRQVRYEIFYEDPSSGRIERVIIVRWALLLPIREPDRFLEELSRKGLRIGQGSDFLWLPPHAIRGVSVHLE